MKIKELVICIIIPLLVGFLSSLFVSEVSIYNDIVKPFLAPPSILFPIVWTLLYILMGISSYLIYKSNSFDKDEALFIYFIQLFVNFLWTPLFFNFRLYFISFLWIILLDILVIVMIIKFYKINKASGLLQVPYLLWLLFATYLNLSIFILN